MSPGHDGSGNAIAVAAELIDMAPGDAAAIWGEASRTGRQIHANRYIRGTGWGSAESIENVEGNVFNTESAVNASGVAIAVWTKREDSSSARTRIYASRFQ